MLKVSEEEEIKLTKKLSDEICKIGRLSLVENVKRLGEYPVIKYEDKNKHITPLIELISRKLQEEEMFNLLETFWLNITSETDNINETRVNKLNRGISLGNMGVFQIVQTKVSEGIFNLYRALADDEQILKSLGLDSDPEKNLVNIPLFSQFEDEIIRKIITQILKPNLSIEENLPSFEKLRAFFQKQEPAKRLFIFQKITQLFSALRKNTILDNMMSRQSILDTLSTLCLWVEDSLRKNDKSIQNLYNGLVFLKLPDMAGGYKSTNLDELVNKISEIKESKDIKVKRALTIILIRNYSSHNLEAKAHPFFASQGKIFSYVADIFFTMLHLESLTKI